MHIDFSKLHRVDDTAPATAPTYEERLRYQPTINEKNDWLQWWANTGFDIRAEVYQLGGDAIPVFAAYEAGELVDWYPAGPAAPDQ